MNTIKNFFIHWKTSLAGIAAGAFTAVQGGQNIKNVLAGAAIALLGLLSKDGDKA